MRVRRWGLKGVALASLLVCVNASAQPASGVYSCTDGRGRKLTADRPIPECTDREQSVLSPSGVKTRIGPTLTAQERADAEAKEKEAAEVRALQTEERRRERALLIRYPSREVHDKERAEALAQVGQVVQAANKRIEQLQVDRSKLDTEMEFYKKDPSRAPPSIRRQMEDINQSMAVQKRFVSEQDNETRRINTRFDEELARLKQLWLAQAGPARPAAAAANPKKAP